MINGNEKREGKEQMNTPQSLLMGKVARTTPLLRNIPMPQHMLIYLIKSGVRAR
jgi:hypothetical protein